MTTPGLEMKLIVPGQDTGIREPDPALIKAVGQAHRWWGDLLAQRYATMRELAYAYDTDERYVGRIIPLAFEPAALARAILEGCQPVEFTLSRFLQNVSSSP